MYRLLWSAQYADEPGSLRLFNQWPDNQRLINTRQISSDTLEIKIGTGSQFIINEHIKVIVKSFFAPKHESNEEIMITT